METGKLDRRMLESVFLVCLVTFSNAVSFPIDTPVIKGLQNMKVVEGRPAVLNCEINKGPVSLSWRKANRDVIPGRSGIDVWTFQTMNNSKSVLRINETIIKVHKRQYSCISHGFDGTSLTASARLHIYNPRKVPSDFPTITDEPTDSEVQGNGSVTLACTATSRGQKLPGSAYRWIKDGFFEVTESSSFRDGRLKIDEHGNLVIVSGRPYDKGSYECLATNVKGTAISRSARLSYSPGNTCVDRKGVEVNQGERYESDSSNPCLTCVCGSGPDSCIEMICDAPPCRNYNLIPDTCCGFECTEPDVNATCTDRSGRIIQRGKLYMPESDPCIQCICKFSETFEDICMTPTCEQPTCDNYVLSNEVCCEYSCNGSVPLSHTDVNATCTDRNGIIVQRGKLYMPESDPCIQCICKFSETFEDICVAASCEPPMCDNYVPSKEVCCEYSCIDPIPLILTGSTCVDRKGLEVNQGERYESNSSNPCLTCVCGSGPDSCIEMICDAPPCRNYNLIPDTCCGFECIENGSTCVDRNGLEVNKGERYESDSSNPCLTCVCGSGPDSCIEMICDAPPCRNYNLIPDTCCGFECIDNGSTCVDRNGLEVNKGERYESNSSNPCLTCVCGSGPDSCIEMICDAPPCKNYNLIPDTCCGFECIEPGSTCVDRKGVEVNQGERYESDSSNPCLTCVCGSGPDSCIEMICDAPPCRNYNLIPDTCCGFECIEPDVNSTCTDRSGRIIQRGKLYMPESDPCIQCICKFSETFEDICMTTTCEQPTCDNYVLSNEVCCEYSCNGSLPLSHTDVNATCTDRNGIIVQRGKLYMPESDPCIQCICKFSETFEDICVAASCEPPMCDNYVPSKEVCCEYSCIDPIPLILTGSTCVDRKGLEVNQGERYESNSSNPCLTCVCGSGPDSCIEMICDAPPCRNYNLIPDTCCGFECIENGSTCVDRNGLQVNKGERYESDSSNPCLTCVCGSGPDSCIEMICDAPPCRNYNLIPDTCCGFECIENGSTCVDRNGLEVNKGERYESNSSNPCLTCVCGSGPDSCIEMICDAPPCKNYNLIPDTCCGFECIEPGNTCVNRKGVEVNQGERYESDSSNPCLTCVCGSGPDSCIEMICDAPPCRNYNLIPDTCCGFECTEPDVNATCTDRSGRIIQRGKLYMPESDPCIQCICKFSETFEDICMTPTCEQPTCDNYVLSNEVCCEYSCNGSVPLSHTDVNATCTDRNGIIVQRGKLYMPESDPCIQCICKFSETFEDICVAASCEPPMCDNYVPSKEVCCEYSCIDPIPLILTGSTCVDRKGVEVNQGERYESDSSNPCLTCVCGSGPDSCIEMICDAPPCRNYNLIPDTCCVFECIENVSTCVDRKGLEVNQGERYESNSSNPCLTCVCGSGPDSCIEMICDAPPCRNYNLIPDTCCGFECIELDANATCTDRNGRIIQRGEMYMPKADPCIQCICKLSGKGEDVCMTTACEQPTCDNYVLSNEVCCEYSCNDSVPLSHTERTYCTDRKGSVIQAGEYYHPYVEDPCTICKCSSDPDILMCSNIGCDMPDCPNYEWIEGECCDFVCIPSEPAIIDVRQIGSDGVLVQCALFDNPSADIKEFGLYYSHGLDVGHDPWEHVMFTYGQRMAIVRPLDPNRLYKMKVTGKTAATNISFVSQTVDFSFDGRVGNSFLRMDPSRMKADVYMNLKPLEDVLYLRTDSFSLLKTVKESCSFDINKECSGVIGYGVVDTRLEFQDEMDFTWAMAHF